MGGYGAGAGRGRGGGFFSGGGGGGVNPGWGAGRGGFAGRGRGRGNGWGGAGRGGEAGGQPYADYQRMLAHERMMRDQALTGGQGPSGYGYGQQQNGSGSPKAGMSQWGAMGPSKSSPSMESAERRADLDFFPTAAPLQQHQTPHRYGGHPHRISSYSVIPAQQANCFPTQTPLIPPPLKTIHPAPSPSLTLPITHLSPVQFTPKKIAASPATPSRWARPLSARCLGTDVLPRLRQRQIWRKPERREALGATQEETQRR